MGCVGKVFNKGHVRNRAVLLQDGSWKSAPPKGVLDKYFGIITIKNAFPLTLL
jgi:hypothetical protein